MVVTTGAVSRAKLQSDHHHQQTNTKSFFYRPHVLPVAQPTVSKYRREMNYAVPCFEFIMLIYVHIIRFSNVRLFQVKTVADCVAAAEEPVAME